jgi:hypothetical protein
MAYFIFARDGTSRIVLKRDSKEAAERKARELEDLGWFDVHIEVADNHEGSLRNDASNRRDGAVTRAGGELKGFTDASASCSSSTVMGASVALGHFDRPRIGGVEARPVRDDLEPAGARSKLVGAYRPLSLQLYGAPWGAG